MTMLSKLILIIGVLALNYTPTSAAMLPPFFLDTVVAIGGYQSIAAANGVVARVWVTEGTGFVYGSLSQDDPDPLKKKYLPFLITAKHVIEGHQGGGQNPMYIRMNVSSEPPSTEVQQIEVPLLPSNNWFFNSNPNLDVAILPLESSILMGHQFVPFFPSDRFSANIGKLKELGLSAGDGVFVLGFPMGLSGEKKNQVVVREGIIARSIELLDQVSPTFMIDSFVFPGNSGGPVILKPEATSVLGTKAQPAAYLIGIVLSYIPYSDAAVSVQTKKPRIIFEENSGLTNVLPTDCIDETIATYLKLNPVAQESSNAPISTP